MFTSYAIKTIDYAIVGAGKPHSNSASDYVGVEGCGTSTVVVLSFDIDRTPAQLMNAKPYNTEAEYGL